MATPEELVNMIAGTLRISQELNAAFQNLRAENQAVPRDNRGYSQKELDKLALDFAKTCPSFERGKDRWADFADMFELHMRKYQVTDAVAKEALWLAVKGRSSRIVIASMRPDRAPHNGMTFEAYLQEMAGKFMPASESMQMKTEYKSRIQGRQEDVQNYINEKFELYKMAYPGEITDLADFYNEASIGILNKSVRRDMLRYRARDVSDYGQQAVFLAQVERQAIARGDSDEKSLDGLVSVTRPSRTIDGHEPMEVDHLMVRREENREAAEDCECMAMYEQGFRGPCYYCRKQGHMLRSCPRKSAGLPKVAGPPIPAKSPAKSNVPQKKWTGTKPGQGAKKPFRSARKVQHLDDEEDETEDEDQEEEDCAEEDAEEVGFLGETL
jgi:hypothetical protein